MRIEDDRMATHRIEVSIRDMVRQLAADPLVSAMALRLHREGLAQHGIIATEEIVSESIIAGIVWSVLTRSVVTSAEDVAWLHRSLDTLDARVFR